MASRNEAGYYGAIARLDAGFELNDIAEELAISVNTVRRWKREYEESKQNGTLDSLLSMDDMIAEITKLSLPLPEELVDSQLDKLAASVKGLQSLQEDFQTTARYLNTRIKSMAMSADSTGELVDLINGLATLQNAFFNKNTTQVNVQNNYGNEGSKYSTFLSDKPNV